MFVAVSHELLIKEQGTLEYKLEDQQIEDIILTTSVVVVVCVCGKMIFVIA
jgi:hypothetical protein